MSKDTTSKDEPSILPLHARKYPEGMDFDDGKFFVDANSIKTEEDIRTFKKAKDAFDEQKKRNFMLRYLHGDLSEIYPEGGHFEFPVSSVGELVEKAKKFRFTPNQLRQEIEQTCNAQIGKIQKAKEIVSEMYTREKLEDCA
jgi:hypothetical protein